MIPGQSRKLIVTLACGSRNNNRAIGNPLPQTCKTMPVALMIAMVKHDQHVVTRLRQTSTGNLGWPLPKRITDLGHHEPDGAGARAVGGVSGEAAGSGGK